MGCWKPHRGRWRVAVETVIGVRDASHVFVRGAVVEGNGRDCPYHGGRATHNAFACAASFGQGESDLDGQDCPSYTCAFGYGVMLIHLEILKSGSVVPVTGLVPRESRELRFGVFASIEIYEESSWRSQVVKLRKQITVVGRRAAGRGRIVGIT